MPSLMTRGSFGSHETATVDLYCTSCDSHVGTYENEWIRLTSSYIIPKVNGTKFGINVADEHRTVDGKEATALHGCDLSEASCSKCSRAIGHFCRNAPGKSHLAGQYIYKLSKTYLKQTRTSTHVTYNFTFGANQPQQDRTRSMFTAPPRPAQSISPYLHGDHNEAARKSMGPPSTRPNGGLMIDPALTASVPTPPNNRESSTQSTEPIREGKGEMRETSLILQKLEEQDIRLTEMSESIDDWKIQNGRLLAAFMRSDPEALTQQGTSDVLETLMDDFEIMVSAAYEARSGNDELETLRAENEAMKAKLQTIALAMGSAIRDTTPTSQPLTSPMTASSTPSVLGKRKRIDARSRHSLLQNEVSFTDEDDLNDQSGLYDIGNANRMRSTPARQPERLSTPSLSNARVSQQYRQTPATAISSAKPTAAPTDTGQTLAKTTTQVLTPLDSSSAVQHGRESRSTESDQPMDVEPDYSSYNASVVSGSIDDANADFDQGQNAYGPEVVEGQVGGMTSTANAANDPHEFSPLINRPQRARKPTPKVAIDVDTEEADYVAEITDKQQKIRVLPTEDETVEQHSRETRASVATVSRRRTMSVVPDGADTEQERHEINRDKDQRRKTTNIFPQKFNVDTQDRSDSSRPIRPQRMTRAAASQVDRMQGNGNVNGSAEVHDGMSEGLSEEGLGQDTSMVTVNDDEEREELFQQHQNNQQQIQMTGNNKENEQPVFAQSADGAQSKQFTRRNRDPNRPKRIRRKPGEIERKYKCLYPGCTKAYGELPHLNTHIGDSGHGEKWSKTNYLEASRKQGDNVGVGTGQGDSMDLDRLAEERNVEDAVAELKRDQQTVNKIRQRDRMAKEAMEREEMMELMNGV